MECSAFHRREKDLAVYPFIPVVNAGILVCIPPGSFRSSGEHACPDFTPDGSAHSIAEPVVIVPCHRGFQPCLQVCNCNPVLIPWIGYVVEPAAGKVIRCYPCALCLENVKPDKLQVNVIVGDRLQRFLGCALHEVHTSLKRHTHCAAYILAKPAAVNPVIIFFSFHF